MPAPSALAAAAKAGAISRGFPEPSFGEKEAPIACGPRPGKRRRTSAGSEFLEVEAPRPRRLGEGAHVRKALFLENQADMAGPAKLDVAAEHLFRLAPKRQRAMRERKLGQVSSGAANVAEGRHRGARADPAALDQRDAHAAPGEEIGRRRSHKAAAQDYRIHACPPGCCLYRPILFCASRRVKDEYRCATISQTYGDIMRARQLEVFYGGDACRHGDGRSTRCSTSRNRR